LAQLKVQLDAFENGEVDEVYLCYNRFINTMKQEPVIEKILPLEADKLQPSRKRLQVTVGIISMSQMLRLS
jgi:F-type H+-transporting ATPase subunit gamma